jgi:hypothetical protein
VVETRRRAEQAREVSERETARLALLREEAEEMEEELGEAIEVAASSTRFTAVDAVEWRGGLLLSLTEGHPPGKAFTEALRRGRECYGPGRPGAVTRYSRFPMKIGFVWRFCMGARGA